jgi:hypothetical protein
LVHLFLFWLLRVIFVIVLGVDLVEIVWLVLGVLLLV